MKNVALSFPVKRYDMVMEDLAMLLGKAVFEERRRTPQWKEWSGTGNSSNLHNMKIPLSDHEYAKVVNHEPFAFYVLHEIAFSKLLHYNAECKRNPHLSSEDEIFEQEELLDKIRVTHEEVENGKDVIVTISQFTFSHFLLAM